MRLPLLEYSSKHTCPPHNTPAHLTTHLSTSTHLPTSQHTCPPHNTPIHLTTHLPTSQHTCPPHNTPAHLTTHLSTSQHTYPPHNTPAYLTTHLPTSQHTCLPHNTPAYLTILFFAKCNKSIADWNTNLQGMMEILHYCQLGPRHYTLTTSATLQSVEVLLLAYSLML